MSRRHSAIGWALLALSMVLLFLPFAAVSAKTREEQTATVFALLLAVIVASGVWLVLGRGARPPRSAYFAVAGLAGSLMAIWWVRTLNESIDRRALAAMIAVTAVVNGVGVWLAVTGSRRAFEPSTRILGGSAVVLAFAGLLLWPSLLLQPEVATHNLDDVQLQLRAGYRYWTIGALLLVAPFLALTTLPGDWFERGFARVARSFTAMSSVHFQLALVTIVLLLAAGISIYSFARRPTTADEIAQLWHARILTTGRLALPADPHPEFFAVDNIIDRPRWLSQFPIGGPLFLAPGVLAGAAWLLNPIVTALLALVTYRFARDVYGEWQGRAAAIIVALSPMILIMGGTHMNHPPTALLVMCALAAFAQWSTRTDPRVFRRSALVIGASLGVALTIRPLDAVIAGALLAVAMLWTAGRDRQRARTLPLAIAAGAVPLALLLWANWRTTGDPMLFGYQLLWGPNHSLGLHDDPLGNPHTPWRALLLAVKYTAQLNWIATAWPVPVIAMVAAGLLCARTVNRWDLLLLVFVAAQIVTYAFYWHDGQFVGPRFVFSAVPALLVLAARAPFLAADRAGAGVWWRIAVLTVPVCLGVSWLRSMRPYGVQGLVTEFRETRTRLKLDPPEAAERGQLGRALIFVQEGASSRLVHRLWGLGISRPDAARLLATADACSLVEAVRVEEERSPIDTVGRAERIAHAVQPFVHSPQTPRLPDPGFRVSDSTAIRGACAREVAHDYRVRNTVAFGPMLLRNQIDADGRIGGDVVYALDLGERNAVLRGRFGDRAWYRFEVPRARPGNDPILVPYEEAGGDSARSVRNRPPQ